MYNIRVLAISLVYWIMIHEASADLGGYPVRNFSPVEYKAGIQNIDFAQNRDRSLFIANNLGVLSYNGDQWNSHRIQTGKKQRSLAFDRHTNRLYVGSQGDFGYFHNDWEYVSLLDRVPDAHADFDEVWDVYLINETVYFCTFQGIYKYDKGEISVFGSSLKLDKSFQVVNRLFTQDSQGRLYELIDDQLKLITDKSGSDALIRGLVSVKDGFLVFYNSGKVAKLDLSGSLVDQDASFSFLEGEYINHVMLLADSRISIATQTSGIFIYDAELNDLEKISTYEGLGSNACLRLFQDYSGNLWAGLQNGIALIDLNSPMRILDDGIGLEGSGYEVLEFDNGKYFSTSNGIYYLKKGDEKCQFVKGTEGPGYSFYEVGGHIYAGHHQGVFELNGTNAQQLVNINGVWDIKMLRNNPGYAVGGTYAGLYLFKIEENQSLLPLGFLDGFSESSRFFEEDSEGNIWVGQYYKGLFKLELLPERRMVQVLSDQSTYDEFENRQIILSLIDDNIFVGSTSGLFVYDATIDSFKRPQIFDEKIAREHVYLMQQDQRNNILIYTEHQVGYLSQISHNNYSFLPSSLTKLRYHLNNDLLNVSYSTDGKVYVSGNEGFITYDPELEMNKLEELTIIVQSIQDDLRGKTYARVLPFEEVSRFKEEVVIDSRSDALTIRVETYQFDNINDRRYWYHLDNFDHGQVPYSINNYKEYMNLKHGDYTLQVSTLGPLGEKIFAEPVYIKINPSAYQTLWAKSGYIILGMMGIFFLARMQRRFYKKKSEEVASSKQDEIDQKQKEVSDLAKEKIANELDHLNSQLAASTMNLVVKNNFIDMIREEINQIKAKDVRKETKLGLDKIIKEIDSSLKVQEDWEKFENFFDKVHGDFLARFRKQFTNLTPNEQKLCAFLRLNLNTKEIANLLKVSVRGVEIARYRLRKKLELDKGVNLSKYIIEF